MGSVRLKSLRARLLAIVAVSVVPAFGLIVYTGLEQRREAVGLAQEAAVRLARLAASEQGRRLGGARDLLVALSRLPEVRRRDAAACGAVLADLRRQYDLYLNFGAIDERGRLVCSALPAADDVALGDRPYFQRAVATRRFAVGDYQVGRVTGKASLNVAYPILSEGGAVEGAVFAAIDLGWLRQLVQDAQLPPRLHVHGDRPARDGPGPLPGRVLGGPRPPAAAGRGRGPERRRPGGGRGPRRRRGTAAARLQSAPGRRASRGCLRQHRHSQGHRGGAGQPAARVEPGRAGPRHRPGGGGRALRRRRVRRPPREPDRRRRPPAGGRRPVSPGRRTVRRRARRAGPGLRRDG